MITQAVHLLAAMERRHSLDAIRARDREAPRRAPAATLCNRASPAPRWDEIRLLAVGATCALVRRASPRRRPRNNGLLFPRFRERPRYRWRQPAIPWQDLRSAVMR